MLQSISQTPSQNEPLAVATIISREGSTPRTPATKMLVIRDGRTVGSIGGGLMEAEVVQTARALFENPQALIEPFHLEPETSNHLAAMCGGRVRTPWNSFSRPTIPKPCIPAFLRVFMAEEGYSSQPTSAFYKRMGKFKPLLSFGSQTIVEHVIGDLRHLGLKSPRWRRGTQPNN